jgi:hypothetical protein
LHVPSIGLIVAGDVVYNGIHPYLVETDTQSRLEWIAALDKLEALKPQAVIAGHKIPENDDDPRNIAETRQYLRDFNRLDEATTTARELYDAMLKLYPEPRQPWFALERSKCCKEAGLKCSDLVRCDRYCAANKCPAFWGTSRSG